MSSGNAGADAERTTTPSRQRQVLLVEDEVRLRGVLARFLRASGHVVQEVGTAADACAALGVGVRGSAATSPVDVLVLDINLPDATGWEVLRQLRDGWRTDLAGTPRPFVIVMTAGTAAFDRVRDLAPDALLPKPFPIHALGRLVATGNTPVDGSLRPNGAADAAPPTNAPSVARPSMETTKDRSDADR